MAIRNRRRARASAAPSTVTPCGDPCGTTTGRRGTMPWRWIGRSELACVAYAARSSCIAPALPSMKPICLQRPTTASSTSGRMYARACAVCNSPAWHTSVASPCSQAEDPPWHRSVSGSSPAGPSQISRPMPTSTPRWVFPGPCSAIRVEGADAGPGLSPAGRSSFDRIGGGGASLPVGRSVVMRWRLTGRTCLMTPHRGCGCADHADRVRLSSGRRFHERVAPPASSMWLV